MESLVHVLGGQEGGVVGEAAEHRITARRTLLSLTPRLVAALASLWGATKSSGRSIGGQLINRV